MKEELLFDSLDVPTDKARVAAYIDWELKEKLEALAALEDRSVSNFVERLIKEAVSEAEREGKLPSNEQSK
jgi:hypothetical protein